jgi:chromosome partitioning protein
VRRELNPRLVLTGLVITMYDERTRLARDVEAELRSHFGELVFDTVIPRSVRIAESPSYGVPVTVHSPASRGAGAYRLLARELAERERLERARTEQLHGAAALSGPVMEVRA